MAEYLQPFISYKQQLGFNIGVLFLEDYKTSDSTEIKYLIEHNGIFSNPDYVLLVGNLNDIPVSAGIDDWGNPYTDDFYHPMLGRWIIPEIENYTSLSTIIQKTIYSEQQFSSILSSNQSVLFSGTDERRRRSRQFYQRIQNIRDISFNHLGMQTSLYDGRDSNVSFSSMVQALAGNPPFFIYSGHGELLFNSDSLIFYASAILSPYYVESSNNLVTINISYNPISSFNNTFPHPLGFGFACDLNSFRINNSFGAKWVSESSGGTTFYGATTQSENTSNHYFSRKVFKTFRKLYEQMHNLSLGLWLRTAEQKYYSALKCDKRFVEILMYNLIGDPTFNVSGISNPMQAPFLDKELFEEDEQQEIISVDIYNIYGQLIESHNSWNFSLPQDNQVYILRAYNCDGSVISYKKINKQ